MVMDAAVPEFFNGGTLWFSSLPNFVEIYVQAPLEVCMERDVKGLYAKARRGEITQVTGVDDPYEEPLTPEIVIETGRMSVEQCTRHILLALERRSNEQTLDPFSAVAPQRLRGVTPTLNS
jgi:adenylylsulfate kinase-like enzyme